MQWRTCSLAVSGKTRGEANTQWLLLMKEGEGACGQWRDGEKGEKKGARSGEPKREDGGQGRERRIGGGRKWTRPGEREKGEGDQ